MKSIFSVFKNMQAFSFLVGMVLGSALGLILFCYMVPHGPKAIAMLRHYTLKMRGQEVIAVRNRDAFRALYASTSSQMSTMNHATHAKSENNPYMMGDVTSEKQFLKEMQAHHESAVAMAQQVLMIPSVHEEVKKLANDIIKAQNSEIAVMKSWMKLWKYE